MRFNLNIYVLGVSALIACVPSVSFGKKKHGAHQHGHGKLNIAIDGTESLVEFTAPSISIYGFEHEAKSPRDIKLRDDARDMIKNAPNKLIDFPSAMGCVVLKLNVDPWVVENSTTQPRQEKPKTPSSGGTSHSEGEHGEFRVSAQFKCKNPVPQGASFRIGLFDIFPRLKEIDLQMITDQKQLGLELTKKNSTITL